MDDNEFHQVGDAFAIDWANRKYSILFYHPKKTWDTQTVFWHCVIVGHSRHFEMQLSRLLPVLGASTTENALLFRACISCLLCKFVLVNSSLLLVVKLLTAIVFAFFNIRQMDLPLTPAINWQPICGVLHLDAKLAGINSSTQAPLSAQWSLRELIVRHLSYWTTNLNAFQMMSCFKMSTVHPVNLNTVCKVFYWGKKEEKKKHKISFCFEKEGCLFSHSGALKTFEICKTESSFSNHTSECETKYNRRDTFLRLKIQHAARKEKVSLCQAGFLQCRTGEKIQVHLNTFQFNTNNVMALSDAVLRFL